MDKQVFNKFIGKVVLVGIAFFDDQHNFRSQNQLHGTITAINPIDGIVIELSNGKGRLSLPPYIEGLLSAASGEYREYSTGEALKDPDFITMWKVTLPQSKSENWHWKPGPKIRFPDPPGSNA